MKKLMILVLSLVLLMAAFMPANAEGGDDRLVVTGTATVSLKSDMATIELGAQTRGRSVSEAYRENSRVMDALIARLEALGVKREDIRTSQFNVYFEQSYDSMTSAANSLINGSFNVSNMIVITIRDISQVSSILDAASETGANNIYGLSFTSSKSTEAYHQALKRAVADARAKAEILAEASGRTLGRLTLIEEQQSNGMPFGLENRMNFQDAKAGGAPILSGDASVMANVTLHFELK